MPPGRPAAYDGPMSAPVAAGRDFRPADNVDPRLVDGILAAAMSAVVALVVAADLEGTGRAGAGAYLFAAGFGAVLLLRRRAPRLVLAATIASIFVYYMLELPPIGIALPAVAALYSTAEAGRTRFAVAAGGVLVSVAAYFRIAEGLPSSYLVSYDLLTDVTLAAAAIALGLGVRARRDIRAHQEQLRLLTAAEERRETEHRLQAEKAGIARDLHDSIGHTLSVIAVHGNVAAEALGRDEAAAARALDQIRAASSAALRDLRTTVKLLRSPVAGPAERTGLGLARLQQLIAAAQDAGVEVTAGISADSDQLDSAVEAAAYRIIQESLTNVLRHSGARHAAVSAVLRNGILELEITDDGAGTGVQASASGAAARAGGRGIQGMAERAALLGGTLAAGPAPGGGFAVRATLPGRLDR